jgi:hypothetical protein
MMLREYPYNPRHQMVLRLKDALTRAGNDSAAGRMIIAGFNRGPTESKVLPDVGEYPRSTEGTTNIVEIVQISVQHAPEAATDLAEALVAGGVLGNLDTGSLIKLIKGPSGVIQDRFVGLYPALNDLPPKERTRLADLLHAKFLPELLKRRKPVARTANPIMRQEQSNLLDILVELTALKKPINGWQPIGTPGPTERIHRFRSFDPSTDADKLDPAIGPPGRLRKVTLPPGMDGWQMPAFDDSSWQAGRAPIGVGVFKAHGHGRAWTASPDHFFENHSDWGDGEFLVARTTFTMTDADYESVRLVILADQGYQVYLNGVEIRNFAWFAHFPRYEKIMLDGFETQHLREGVNTLAVFANVRFEKDGSTGQYHHVGQIDLWLEGLKRGELGRDK